jgi:hypothetical protein
MPLNRVVGRLAFRPGHSPSQTENSAAEAHRFEHCFRDINAPAPSGNRDLQLKHFEVAEAPYTRDSMSVSGALSDSIFTDCWVSLSASSGCSFFL